MKQSMRITAGAAAVPIVTDDDMVVAGGILPVRLRGEEADLRATAFYFGNPDTRRDGADGICLIACDNLMMERSFLDAAAEEAARRTGIPFPHILICATHTHHAPSLMRIHGYGEDSKAVSRFSEAIAAAAAKALETARECTVETGFSLLEGVGQNSRLRLDDGKILWVPYQEQYRHLPATGPVDPGLTVLSLTGAADGKLHGVLFNHSCHNIGSRTPGRSPGFYGLAARELENQHGAVFGFFPGAAGSTHDMSRDTDALVAAVIAGVQEVLAEPLSSVPAPTTPAEIPAAGARTAATGPPAVWAVRREFGYTVRSFDELAEQAAVQDYCTTMDISDCGTPEEVIGVFRAMRQSLAPHQGERRTTWIQAIRLGELCIVGLPGEIFASLGLEIRKRSPWRHTMIIELANDSIGYVADREAYRLGGYQLWTGFHSLLEEGTGERLVDAVLELIGTGT